MKLKPSARELSRDAKLLKHATRYLQDLKELVTTDEAKAVVDDSIFEIRNTASILRVMSDER